MIDMTEYIEGLNIYYKLKNEYDMNINQNKKKIMDNKLSWREKRLQFNKLKAKCINCNRSVGTVFSNKLMKDSRHLIAMCGDRENPCSLNINIDLGQTFVLDDMIKESEKETSDSKKEVVITKNDLLFGYISSEEAIDKFNKIQEEIKQINLLYEYELEQFNKIVKNPERKEKKEKLQIEIEVKINEIRKYIKEFNETKNTQVVQDVVQLYLDELTPKLLDLMNRLYDYSKMEYDENDNTYHLIQIPYSLENLELNMSKNGESILSFRLGSSEKLKK
jgi:hypothetical protein